METKPFTSASFYQYLDEHKLMGSTCQDCGARFVPPRPICSACQSDQMGWIEMGHEGKLIAFTTVHIAPTAMIEAGYGRENPYCAGIVQLAEGPAISAQILGIDATHPEQIEIGMPVRATFQERDQGAGVPTALAFEAI